MTKEERKKKVDEIRSNQGAFKHWYETNSNIQLQRYEESVGPTIEFLLSEIAIRDEALRLAQEVLLREYGPEFTHPHAQQIREALGEE